MRLTRATTMAMARRLARPGAAIVLGVVGGWLTAKVAGEGGAPGLWFGAMTLGVPSLALLGGWWPQPGSPRRRTPAYRVLVAFEGTVLNLSALSIATAPVLWISNSLSPSNLWVQFVSVVTLGAAALLGGLSLRPQLERLRPQLLPGAGRDTGPPAATEVLR
ncbi:MAG: hypothetical protein ABIM89_16820 [Mycobacteriales bacterium]